MQTQIMYDTVNRKHKAHTRLRNLANVTFTKEHANTLALTLNMQ